MGIRKSLSKFHSGLSPVSPIGKPYAEREVLEIGKAYQDASGFNRLRPDLARLGG